MFLRPKLLDVIEPKNKNNKDDSQRSKSNQSIGNSNLEISLHSESKAAPFMPKLKTDSR